MSKKFKIEVRKSSFNEDEKLTKWQKVANASKWDITLWCGDRSMSFNFYTGEMIKNVDAFDILYCLFDDAAIVDSGIDLAEFLCSFGYNETTEDLREGIRVYNAIIEEAKQFKELLGDDYYDCALDMYKQNGEEFIHYLSNNTVVHYMY